MQEPTGSRRITNELNQPRRQFASFPKVKRMSCFCARVVDCRLRLVTVFLTRLRTAASRMSGVVVH